MRNSILHSALNVSMEGIDPNASAEINPVTEETIVQVDEVLEEAREDSASVDEHDEAVEELSDAAESMESLIASLESAIADGGLSPQAADIHSRALAIATRRLPIDASEFTVSTESFGGTGDKLQASMEALEGAKALLAKIWEAIKNAVVGAWNAVKAFFASMGKSGPAVVAAGQSLKKRAAETKDNGAGAGGTINMGSAGDYLVVGGKVAPAAALAAINHGYDVGVKGYTNKILAALNPLYQSIQKGEVHPDRLKSVAGSINVEACLTEDMKGKLPGGYFFDLTVSDKEGLDGLADASLKLSQDKGAKVAAAEGDIPTVDEISKLADQIVNMGKLIISSKAVAGMAEKGINDAVKAGNSLVSKGDTLDKAEAGSAKAVLAKLNKAARLTTGCSHQYLSFMGSAAKASASFGAKVLSMYGKAAKKADAAAAAAPAA
ncbi:phiKZ-like phage internal head protein [compost metagenome]